MKSKIKLSISGNKPEHFLFKIHSNKINIENITKINKNKIEIIINYSDYEKLIAINTIYDIKILEYLGIVKSKKLIIKYRHMIIIFFLCILGISFFSNIIFKVEIITNDLDMKKNLSLTLAKYNIDKFHLKKDYHYINKVKEKILEEYHDEIEWIEIENIGTKYLVRYEPRILKEQSKKKHFQHVIAKKNAIIRRIQATSGQIIKNKYSYVKKGDIIISGYIYLNDKLIDTTSAKGNVYGEVWYETSVIYPFNYYESKKTGRSKIIYSVKLFNNQYDLFNFKPFNDKIVKEQVILKNNLLPIQLVKQEQEEIIVKTSMNVIEEIEQQAINLAYKKMKDSLQENEYIINYRILDSKVIDKGIKLKIFFSVCENISDYQIIEEKKEVE